MRRIVAGGFGAALLAWAGMAEAQVAPPVVTPGNEFYIGGGGTFGTGIGRSIFGTERLTINGSELSGFAPFAYLGVRTPFRGVFVGLEGEYDFSQRSAGAVIDEPGSPALFNLFTGGTITTVNLGTVGATTTRYNVAVSDRAAVFGTVFVPIAGIELFAKAGMAYWTVKDAYSITYNSPASFVFPPSCFNPCLPQPVNFNNIAVSAKQDVFAPVLGGGVQVPFGSFFLRAEGQVEFTSLHASVFAYQMQSTFNPSQSFLTNATATALANSNARFLLSVGYKW